jgi:hypothetical protein
LNHKIIFFKAADPKVCHPALDAGSPEKTTADYLGIAGQARNDKDFNRAFWSAPFVPVCGNKGKKIYDYVIQKKNNYFWKKHESFPKQNLII